MVHGDLFRRADSQERGRYLVAACRLERGRLILAERPLLVQQSLENLRYNQVCHGCKAFLGGGGLKHHHPSDPSIIPCRHACGHVFCSTECERDTYAAFHQHLCTGPSISVDEPVVQFKQYCVETNEILLLVAEWWISQHTAARKCGGDATLYTDFCMNPWWDVLVQSLSVSEQAEVNVNEFQTQLQDICAKAAELLNQVLIHTEIPCMSSLDIGIRIGACEQNAMGVRQRSPWCRAVFDRQLRELNCSKIVENLQEAGFLGNDEDDDGENDSEHDESIPANSNGTDPIEPTPGDNVTADDTTDKEPTPGPAYNNGTDPTPGDNFTADDLASLLVKLRIDEDGSVRDLAVPDEQQLDCVGDDLDLVFPPLDGTAMYSIACKMNHSCDPNVMLVYRRQTGWGSRYPLTAFCVALRDIAPEEELTISYIDANEPYAVRAEELRNYGFACNCGRCQTEGSEQTVTAVNEKVVDPFGDDSDEESAAQSDDDENSSVKEMPAEERLQERLNRLDSVVNCSRFGSIPISSYAPVSSFILQSFKAVQPTDSIAERILHLFESCCTAVQGHDYCLAKIVGEDLEKHLLSILNEKVNGSNLPIEQYSGVHR